MSSIAACEKTRALLTSTSPGFSRRWKRERRRSGRCKRSAANPCEAAPEPRRQGVDSGHWELEMSDRRDGAPVDDILASGDRCCAIRGEEGDQLGDLCRPARTAKRDAAE